MRHLRRRRIHAETTAKGKIYALDRYFCILINFMCVYVHIYTCIHMKIYVYIYIYYLSYMCLHYIIYAFNNVHHIYMNYIS